MRVNTARDAALGGIIDITSHYKFGRTLVLGALDTNEDVWEVGGAYTGFNATVAEKITAVSSSASDTAVQITFQGLDGNYNSIEETVTLTGQTPILTNKTFLRAPRAFVSGATALVGNVTYGQATTTANVFGSILAIYGQTNIACFTVPEGKDCLIIGLDFSMARDGNVSGSATVALQRRDEGKAWRTFNVTAISTSVPLRKDYATGIKLPEHTDIRARVIGMSGNSSFYTCEIEYLLIKNY